MLLASVESSPLLIAQALEYLQHFAPGREHPPALLFVLLHGVHEFLLGGQVVRSEVVGATCCCRSLALGGMSAGLACCGLGLAQAMIFLGATVSGLGVARLLWAVRFMRMLLRPTGPTRSAALRGWDRSCLPLVPVMADIQIQVSGGRSLPRRCNGVVPQGT